MLNFVFLFAFAYIVTRPDKTVATSQCHITVKGDYFKHQKIKLEYSGDGEEVDVGVEAGEGGGTCLLEVFAVGGGGWGGSFGGGGSGHLKYLNITLLGMLHFSKPLSQRMDPFFNLKIIKCTGLVAQSLTNCG